eukprot:GHVS01055396.1.p1 GENE.GHVS01055396.1~~GHVS01055396.1.p1  ORF type:complete len:264 (-),score=42.25 GHVS01055396.1:538-1299(-)
MAAECDYLPYLALSEEKLSKLWNERKEDTDIFTCVLDEPLDVEGFKAIESVYIEAFKVFRRKEHEGARYCATGLLMFHTKEAIWNNIITGVDSSYLIADSLNHRKAPYVVKRKTVDMRKVATLLQKALNSDDKAVLPAFAVTRFIPTAAEVVEVICLVRPVVKQLIKVRGQKEAFQQEDDVKDWVYKTLPKDCSTKISTKILVNFTLKGKKQKEAELAKKKAEEAKGKKEAEKKGGNEGENEGEKEEAPKGQD